MRGLADTLLLYGPGVILLIPPIGQRKVNGDLSQLWGQVEIASGRLGPPVVEVQIGIVGYERCPRLLGDPDIVPEAGYVFRGVRIIGVVFPIWPQVGIDPFCSLPGQVGVPSAVAEGLGV